MLEIQAFLFLALDMTRKKGSLLRGHYLKYRFRSLFPDLTIKEVAKKIDCNYWTLQRIIRGDHKPSKPVALKIQKAVGKDIFSSPQQDEGIDAIIEKYNLCYVRGDRVESFTYIQKLAIFMSEYLSLSGLYHTTTSRFSGDFDGMCELEFDNEELKDKKIVVSSMLGEIRFRLISEDCGQLLNLNFNSHNIQVLIKKLEDIIHASWL